ncbi:hypothetical protein GCM10008935_05400 [Alkalibacillus silvisoli]|uniref:DUF5659 domain-containing protein n=1 Tax=Alkalibacillus silvisoli TaxID=392823 RepID=A0ABN0ZP18_9BACI
MRVNDIQKIMFKRVGFKQSGAVIKLKSGFNIRVYLFKPKRIYQDLDDFAERYEVSKNKTEDYLILEKMNRKKVIL